MKYIIIAMSTPPFRAKRQRPDDELDTRPQIKMQNFPRFIVVQALNKEKPITSLSPFAIEKKISGILGTPASIKNLRNGSLLVEVNRKGQADNLLKTKSFLDQTVNVYAHPTLNSSRGVVRCREISDTPLDEIKAEMKDEGVTDVKRITIKRNGKDIQTHTYIFTFNTPVLPTSVKIAYYYAKVEVYIPNPLQCFRCQKFGHHEDGCKAQEAVCGRCARTGHIFRDCQADETICANCQQDHPSNSRKCCFWKKEKEILRIKYTENISFSEARTTFETRNKIIEQSNSYNSYANVSKPKTTECNGCKVLVDKLCHLFPEKATEIRQLVQHSGDVPVSTSNAVTTTPKTPETTEKQSQKVKKPEQNTTTTKANNTPKKKIDLNGKSISKNTPSDSSKANEKKIKLRRCVVADDNVALQPIPTTSNQYQVLSDMEEDGREDEDSSEEFSNFENT